MSMKIMKKAIVSSIGAAALLGAASAQAITVEYPGTYTFEGQTTLSASFVTATCNLSLTGDVDAAGNVSAPVMGHTYPGPGGTIGPAMTFGYLAALHIAATGHRKD